MTWGLTVKREGIFENALRVDVKNREGQDPPFNKNPHASKLHLISLNRENQQESGMRGRRPVPTISPGLRPLVPLSCVTFSTPAHKKNFYFRNPLG